VNPLLAVSDLDAGYAGVPVVRGLNLTVDRGEIVVLLGPNGAGKTTTLSTIAAVLRPLAGRIELSGLPLNGLPVHAVARRGVALVPEDRGLFQSLSAAENLRLAQRRTRRIADILPWFPALSELLKRRAGLLSGGEQQMLSIARALLTGPSLLMIDELSHGLAPRVVGELLPLLRQIANETAIGILLVEQHARLALTIADRAYVLSRGQLVLEGEASEIRARQGAIESSYLGTRT